MSSLQSNHKKKGFSASAWFILMLVLMVPINIIASFFHSRLDLTNEKRFTLSKGTTKLLKHLDSTVTVDVFLKGNYPSGFRKLGVSTEDMLREFKELAGTQLVYHIISPEELVEGTQVTYADSLDAMGVPSINLTAQVKGGQQQQRLFPVALMHYNNRILPVEIFKGKTPQLNYKEIIGAEALLEYQLANGIAKITEKKKAAVAYATGNGEPMDERVYDLAEQTIGPAYDLQLVDLATQPFIAPEFKALIIVKPTLKFSDYEKLKLDQYIMNGGKVLFFIDKLNAEMDSLQVKNEVVAYERDLELNDLLFKYGVRVNPSLLMDLQCDYLPFDVSGNGQFEFLPWNYFPVLESPNNHPINKNLGYVAGRFVNPIDTIEAEGIKKTILLWSSTNARIISSPALISGRENVTAPENEKFKTPHVPVAVLLEGKFFSLYRNRLTQALNDSLQQYGMEFLPEAIQRNQLLVASDGDLVLNAVAKGGQPLPMGMNPFTYGSQRQFPFVNREFLLNALDHMINEHDLSEAKNKDYIVRLLDKKKIEEEQMQWQLINIAMPIVLVILFALLFQWIRSRSYAQRRQP